MLLTNQRTQPRNPARQLRFEQLETRDLLAVAIGPFPVDTPLKSGGPPAVPCGPCNDDLDPAWDDIHPRGEVNEPSCGEEMDACGCCPLPSDDIASDKPRERAGERADAVDPPVRQSQEEMPDVERPEEPAEAETDRAVSDSGYNPLDFDSPSAQPGYRGKVRAITPSDVEPITPQGESYPYQLRQMNADRLGSQDTDATDLVFACPDDLGDHAVSPPSVALDTTPAESAIPDIFDQQMVASVQDAPGLANLLAALAPCMPIEPFPTWPVITTEHFHVDLRPFDPGTVCVLDQDEGFVGSAVVSAEGPQLVLDLARPNSDSRRC